jgi:uncharacterized protein (TIGR03083 family)
MNLLKLAVDEQTALKAEFDRLPSASWARPSQCGGWRNARVLAHLTAGADLYHQSISRALESAEISDDTAARLVACFEIRQERLTELPIGALLDAFAVSGSALATLLEQVDAEDLERPTWHPMRTVTIGTLIAFRIFELGFHGWDIRASSDARAVIRHSLTPFLVGFVRQAQQRFCRPAPDLEGTCRFDVDAKSWALRIDDGELFDAPMTEAADIAIETDASTFLLLSTRRRSLADVLDRVWLCGERQRVAELLDATTFSI